MSYSAKALPEVSPSYSSKSLPESNDQTVANEGIDLAAGIDLTDLQAGIDLPLKPEVNSTGYTKKELPE